MPSQFSTIGFSITSGEDLAALASHVADKAERISTPPGDYLKWAPPSGEQLWLQISPEGVVQGARAGGFGDKEVEDCVAAAIQSIQFPKPKGGGYVNVRYPFTFQPAGG